MGVRSIKSRSRDPSPDTTNSIIPRSRAGTRSRDPSPESALQRITRQRSRDPSPLNYTSSRRPSRDPSPVVDSYTNSGSSYRPYSSRLGYTPGTTSNLKSASKTLEDLASKYRYGSSLPRSNERLLSPEPCRYRSLSRQSSTTDDSKRDLTSKHDKTLQDLSPNITVCTRATSPTPPGSSQFVRARRADMAKAIEQTVPRPCGNISKSDKSIQTDKIKTDGSKVSSTPWSSYLDMKFNAATTAAMKFGSPGSRYNSFSGLPIVTTPSETEIEKQNDTKRDTSGKKTAVETEKKSMIPKNKTKSSSSSGSSSLSSPSSSGSLSSLAEDTKRRTPPKTVQTETKKSSDTSSRTQLPPPFPKSESTVRKSPTVNKWPNKDFRKSTLNMSSDKLAEQRNNKNNVNGDSQPNSGSDPSLIKTNSYTKLARSGSSLNKSKSNSASKIANKSEPQNNSVNHRRSRSTSNDSSSDSDSDSSSSSSSENVKNKKMNGNALSRNNSMCKKSNSDLSNKIEESRSFLVRALGPVAKILNKVRHQDSGDRNSWLASFENTDNHSLKPSDSKSNLTKQPSNTSLNSIKENSDKSPGGLSRQNSTASRGSGRFKFKLRHIDSGEKPWWMASEENLVSTDVSNEKAKSNEESNKPMKSVCEASADSEDELTKAQKIEELGDRKSPEGIEDTTSGRRSPYDNVPEEVPIVRKKRPQNLFISKHTNIDDVLGGPTQLLSPLMDRILGKADGEDDDEVFEKIDPGMVRIHDSTAQRPVIHRALTR